jgi:hypothetical protein
MSRETMQLALEALESDPISHAGIVSRKQAITALRQALETDLARVGEVGVWGECEWVGLTDEEIFSILENLQTIYNRPPTEDSRIIFAQAIEAKLKEKNT